MAKTIGGIDSAILGQSSLIIKNEFDIVVYQTESYPLDVALSRAFNALKDGGKFVILHNQNSKIIDQWSTYREYALSMFALESEKKNDITMIKSKDIK